MTEPGVADGEWSIGREQTQVRVAGGAAHLNHSGLTFPDPDQALRTALSDFDHGAAQASLSPAAPNVYGRASLFPREDHTIVVVGHDLFADTVRGLLPSRGWNLWPAPSPTEGTALTTIRSALGTRTFNILAREGFVTVEEVAAVPDAGLRTLPNMGIATINTIRFLSAAAAAEPAQAPVTLSVRHVDELSSLLAELTRYATANGNRDLVHQVDAFRVAALAPIPAPHRSDSPGPP